MLRQAKKRLKRLSYSSRTLPELVTHKIHKNGMFPNKARREARKEYVLNTFTNPERRLDSKSVWEYFCEKCKRWKYANGFGKFSRRRITLIDHFCLRCVAKANRKSAEAKIRSNASSAYRRSLQRRSAHLKEEIEKFYEKSIILEKKTGIEHHVDHIVSIKHNLVCGLHTPCNLQVLTAEENWEKGNNFTPCREDRSGKILLLEEGSPNYIIGIKKLDKAPRAIQVIKAKDLKRAA